MTVALFSAPSHAYEFDCSQGDLVCSGDTACLIRYHTCCPPSGVTRELDCSLCGGNWTGDRCLSGEELPETGEGIEVEVNGESESIELTDEDILEIELTFQPQGVLPDQGSYFLWVKLPNGDCLYYSFPNMWRPCSCESPGPAYQGGLVTFSDVILGRVPCRGLPKGTYILYFRVTSEEDSWEDYVEFSIR